MTVELEAVAKSTALSPEDLNGWAEKEAIIRNALDGILPLEGVEWVIADMKRRYDSCPPVQSIAGIFDAIRKQDPAALRESVLTVVQEAVNPWVMCTIALEADLYRTLAAANYAGRA